MKKIRTHINVFLLLLLALYMPIMAQNNFIENTNFQKQYKLWYDEPAPNGGGVIPVDESDRPIDVDWENWSLPIGNGYMGACIFGRTDSERLQITDKTLYIKGLFGAETQTAFADLYIDFFHSTRTNYERSLTLNDGICRVKYEHNSVKYKREYFMSYPDNVMVIKLTADKAKNLSFTVRPEIPYLTPFGPLQRPDSITKGYLSGRKQTRYSYNGRTGQVTAEKDIITLRGKTEYLNLIYEARIKVIPYGGKLTADNNTNRNLGTIHVECADSAVLLFTLGTNYKLDSQTFLAPPKEKLNNGIAPHQQIVETIEKASSKGYEQLLATHKSDYKFFFDRVHLDLGGKESAIPTNQLLASYKQGNYNPYLEELFFQYGRYLLISSSRKGSLPPTLQGVWNQYEVAPWNGNYTHNINIQMNYWPVFTTNLAELFESYVDYHKGYRKLSEEVAEDYIQSHNLSHDSAQQSDNGWIIGTSGSPYSIGAPGGHSGPGTGGLTSKLFWDYYAFTSDKHLLKDVSYPVLLGMATFFNKVVKDTLGYVLATPSSSPEQFSKLTGKPYTTTGCAFDQQMIHECFQDVLKAADILQDKSPLLTLLKKRIGRLDPVQIGASGQIKEYREEHIYGDIILEKNHRHISNLVALYPGTLINGKTQEWLEAAKTTLRLRGDLSTGWSMAHKMNLWARAKDGDHAYLLLQDVLKTATLNNLWTNCIAVLRSPYQIDANFGSTAGIAEMLLQSHEGFIEPLAALPSSWASGSYQGLVARGNFEIATTWRKNKITQLSVHSRMGNVCRLKYPHISKIKLTDSCGNKLKFNIESDHLISFKTTPNEKYNLHW